MPNLGFGELMIVFLIVVVIFGSTKLPQLGDGLGRAIKNFKRAVTPGNELDVSPKKNLGQGEFTEGEPTTSDKSTVKTNS